MTRVLPIAGIDRFAAARSSRSATGYGRRSVRVLTLSMLLAVPLAAAAASAVSPAAHIDELIQRAETLLAAGHHSKALAELESAPTAVLAETDPARRARLDGVLGKALTLAGRQAEAIQRLEHALQLARKEGLPLIAAALLNDLGNARASAGELAAAIAAFRESTGIAAKQGESLLAAKAATNAARAQLRSGRPAAAARSVDEAAGQLALVRTDAPEAPFVQIAAARIMLELHATRHEPAWLTRAHAVLTAAAKTAERRADQRALSYAYGYLGQLYAEERRLDEALGLTQRAIFAAQQVRAEESLYRWHWQAARILKRRGLENEAAAAYRRAIASIWPIRQDLMADARRTGLTYQAVVGNLFLEAAELLIDQSTAVQDARSVQALLVEARDTIEQLKATELEDYFQDDCVAAVRAKQKYIDRIAPNTAVIYPIILPKRIELLVSLPQGLQRFSVPVEAPVLGREVLELRRLLEKRTTHQYLPHARRVYAWLIRPIEGALAAQAVDTLVVVPDGPLRNIPLASLHDGKRFLIERFAVAVAPGLTMIEPKTTARGPIRPLLAGLSHSVQKFPSLPHVDDEVKEIQALHGGTLLRNQSFLVERFSGELRDKTYSVVHVASHGQFEPEARRSFLLAYNGRVTMDNLERLLRLSRFRDEPLELLTLSACRTAAENDRSALGLAGVAVKAGVRSALATLWYVNDQATGYLMADFYRHLAETSGTKAKALQAAQLRMLGERRFRHPGYWSPFLLVGNWL